MTDSGYQIASTQRLPSGVPGLDTILQGGFFQGGSYIITGLPGTGKTILGHQICFNHIAAGRQAVYVTLLSETHARMMAHMRTMDFFKPQAIAQQFFYFSGYHALEQNGLGGLLELLWRVIRDHNASLLVVDGLSNVRAFADSELAFKRFIHELHVYIEVSGCTLLMLTHLDEQSFQSEQAIVDGLITLSDSTIGLRTIRDLQVRKFRGSSYLPGIHHFEICNTGLIIYPRLESQARSILTKLDNNLQQPSFGIYQFDRMLGGGMTIGSTTVLLGAPGSGKTLFGMTFLDAGARLGQPGLFFGFHETIPGLLNTVDRVGLPFHEHTANGLIDMIWQPPLEELLDKLALRLLYAVEERGVQRLFIDGLDGFSTVAVDVERLNIFFTALLNELRARNVTTVFTLELRDLSEPVIELPGWLAALVDNIIFLRYTEHNASLQRLVSIVKMRDRQYDPSVRMFTISSEGIAVATTAGNNEVMLHKIP